MTASRVRQTPNIQWRSTKSGRYVQMKRLMFTKSKILEPVKNLEPSLPIWNLHYNLPNTDLGNSAEFGIYDKDFKKRNNQSTGFASQSEYLKSKIERQK